MNIKGPAVISVPLSDFSPEKVMADLSEIVREQVKLIESKLETITGLGIQNPAKRGCIE